MNRRGFLFAAAATLVAAPAIVRVASVMPVKAVELAESQLYRCEAGSWAIVGGFDEYGRVFQEILQIPPINNDALVELMYRAWEDAKPYSLGQAVRAS